MKRTKTFRIRLSDEELAALEERFGKAQTSTAVRKFLLSSELPRRSRKPDPATLAALGRIGNNLNQIARSAYRTPKEAKGMDLLAFFRVRIQTLSLLKILRNEFWKLAEQGLGGSKKEAADGHG